MNSKLKVVLSVAVVIAIAGAYMFPKFVPSFGASAGPTYTEGQELVGGLTLGLVNSTSTTDTAYTMVAADLASPRQGTFYDTYIHMKTGSVATTTNTFPASSTLSYVLPRAGMRTSVCFVVATSTGGAGLVLAEGTGWKIVNASSTIAVTGGGTLFSNAGALGRTVQGGQPSCGMIVRERAVSSSPGFVDSTSTTPGDLVLILMPTYPSQ